MGVGFGGEWIHAYVLLNSFAVHLELSQHCLLIGYVLVTQLCPALCDPWIVAYQPPLFMEFSRHTGVGCHSLLLGIFLTQGLKPGLLHCSQILYHLSPQGSPQYKIKSFFFFLKRRNGKKGLFQIWVGSVKNPE